MLGGIADDLTGATDLATSLTARGLDVAITFGPPGDDEIAELGRFDAVVVALKVRTSPVRHALTEVRSALTALREIGCTKIYDKYCSTFDSTPEGNIGPILDVLADELDASHAVVVPSFPDAGRTVYLRHLFVGDQLLADSPMRHHPLTPMTDSDLVALLRPQTPHRVGAVYLDDVRAGTGTLRAAIAARVAEGNRYVVVDAIANEDLTTIAASTAEDQLVSGGSGLALGLPPVAGRQRPMPVADGRRVILSGSASETTRRQVDHARQRIPYQKLDLASLGRGVDDEIARLADWAGRRWAEDERTPVLLYTVDSLADVRREEAASALVEEALGRCAAALLERGARQFVVAGGETSGSVVGAMGVRRLHLGPVLAPGVSWAHGRSGDRDVNLVLKSGNFGATDLFVTAWEALA